jgi:hypothetical protein
MKRTNILVGSLFIIFGIVLGISLLTNLKFEFWPFFILIPGLIFELSFFNSKKKADPGLLVPGGILTVIGLLFFYQTLTDWKYNEHLWPVFMLAVAVGLFQLYIFGSREKGLLVPVGILTGLFVIFTVGSLSTIKDYFRYIGPLVIIIIGIIVLLTGKSKMIPSVKATEDEDEPILVIDNDDEDDSK